MAGQVPAIHVFLPTLAKAKMPVTRAGATAWPGPPDPHERL